MGIRNSLQQRPAGFRQVQLQVKAGPVAGQLVVAGRPLELVVSLEHRTGGQATDL